MYFDERPKSKREDLFNREKELSQIKNSIGRPLIVITGVRRIGKTSVLRVALNELDRPTVIVDLRGLRREYGRRALYSALARGLRGRLRQLRDVLSRLRGVSIAGFSVEITWRGKNMLSLIDLFDALNEKGAVIAFDEAQNLRGPLSRDVREAIAHAYDYCDNLTIILTGSEVGLLYDFIGVENPESPLFGRFFTEIQLSRFSRDQAIAFLREGFRQANRKPPHPLDIVVEQLNGIPGWLTFYGCRCLEGRTDIEEIKHLAVKLALRELNNLIRNRPRRYKIVLRGIAEGRQSWSQIKRYLEEKEGKTISKSVLHNILKTLKAMSLVENYQFLDPIYREAARLLR